MYFLFSSPNKCQRLILRYSPVEISFQDLGKLRPAHWTLVCHLRPVQNTLETESMLTIDLTKERICRLV